MILNYMDYMFPTGKWYLTKFLGAVRRESSRLTELHKLSRKNSDLHVLRYVFHIIGGLDFDIEVRL